MATPEHLDIETVLSDLSVEEKAALVSGATFWHTAAVERAGVPAIMVADGPHGLRKEVRADDGTRTTVPATCFPPAVTLGSTWDTGLLRRVGVALGRETRANDVAVLLGPGINIKRSPLCGRNFEYLSEDPLVAGHLAAAIVGGIQSEGVGTSLKHFAANNQETDRLRVSADVDERTLREIYLPAFEHVVTRAQPWTVMCAYNRLNGIHASQHHWLLTEVLRDEWGFDGLVVSDWGAVHDRVAALEAGLDLQMPSPGELTNEAVARAVHDGRLEESVLDASARRVLRLVDQSSAAAALEPAVVDTEEHHALAREAATKGAVLLKNEVVGGAPLLPLPDLSGLVVVGELARTPRYQGAGSSQVEPTRVEDVLGALTARPGGDVAFAPGYRLSADPDLEVSLRTEAVDLAEDATTVVAVLGLPAEDESEGYDRTHLELPPSQTALLAELDRVCERVVVVLVNGSAVTVARWDRHAGAVLEAWLGGQAGGAAVADLLVGDASPSGRLSETIPLALEDTPAYGSFPGELGHSRYGEGVLVGYRWYDTRAVDVAYPFGHGLTYTTFAYEGLAAQVTGSGSETEVRLRVRVTNTGERPGTEVVQVYVADPESAVRRPARELRAFERVELDAGASTQVEVTLDARALSYWHPRLRRWVVEGGTFVVAVGSSSRDLRAAVEVDVEGDDLTTPIDGWSTIGEVLAHPVVGERARTLLGEEGSAMMSEFPIGTLADFPGIAFDHDDVDALVRAAND